LIPKPGQHVKLLLRSSITLEGIVEHWSSEQVELKSIDGERLILVHSPIVDIILTTITINPQKSDKQLPEIKEAKDPTINRLNIQQLKSLVKQQDHKIITEKRKEHFGSVGSAKQAVTYSETINILKVK
jgi:predicted SPOUT superfamily RNA methylase MTH1